VSADADGIAALEAELYDRTEHVQELRNACDEKQEAIEQLQHDLSQERGAHERTKAELATAEKHIAALEYNEKHVWVKAAAERDAAIAREQAAQAEASALREVIEEQIWRADHALEAFEEQAETFYRETGILAPGKSEPLEWGDRWTDDERRTAWTEWRIKRNAEQVELWRAVIKGTAGRAVAARVPLWRAIEHRLRWEHGTIDAEIDDALDALAALDEKGTP
jgi:hypothetical protein